MEKRKWFLLLVVLLMLIGGTIFWFFGMKSGLLSSLLDANGKSMTLVSRTSTGVTLGESVKVDVIVRADTPLSKVASAIYYDPHVLTFTGYDLNTNLFLGFELKKENKEMGWIYLADGTRDIAPTASSGDRFVTLSFLAVGSGKGKIMLDTETSKLHFQKEHVPYFFDKSLQQSFTIEVKEPRFDLQLLTPKVTEDKVVKVKAQISDLGTSEVLGVKMREGKALAWERAAEQSISSNGEYTFQVSDSDGEKDIEFLFRDKYGKSYPTTNTGSLMVSMIRDTKAPVVPVFYLAQQQGSDVEKMVFTPIENTKDKKPIFVLTSAPTDESGIKSIKLKLMQNDRLVYEQQYPANQIALAVDKDLPDGKYLPIVEAADQMGRVGMRTGAGFAIGITSLEQAQLTEKELRARIAQLEKEYNALLLRPAASSSGGGGGGGGGYAGPFTTIADEQKKQQLAQELAQLKKQQTSTAENVSNKTTATSEKVASPSPVIPSRVFMDLSSDHWAYDAIAKLSGRGVLTGYADGSIRPQVSITRAEFLKMVISSQGIRPAIATSSPFRDVSLQQWFASYVAYAKENNIISGNKSGEFLPQQPISRAEAIKILLHAYGISSSPYKSIFQDVRSTDWFAAYVQTAYERKIMKGYADQTFQPNRTLSRAEAAMIISSLLAQ